MRYDYHGTARITMLALAVLVPVSIMWSALIVSSPGATNTRALVIGLAAVNLNILWIYLYLKKSFIEVNADGITVCVWPKQAIHYNWAELHEIRMRGREYIVFTDDGTFKIRPVERADVKHYRPTSPTPTEQLISTIKRNVPGIAETVSALHIDLKGTRGKKTKPNQAL